MSETEPTPTVFRRAMTGAAIGAAVGILVCWPWEAFVGVSRPGIERFVPLVPLTVSFMLLGSLVGAALSQGGEGEAD